MTVCINEQLGKTTVGGRRLGNGTRRHSCHEESLARRPTRIAPVGNVYLVTNRLERFLLARLN